MVGRFEKSGTIKKYPNNRIFLAVEQTEKCSACYRIKQANYWLRRDHDNASWLCAVKQSPPPPPNSFMSSAATFNRIQCYMAQGKYRAWTYSLVYACHGESKCKHKRMIAFISKLFFQAKSLLCRESIRMTFELGDFLISLTCCTFTKLLTKWRILEFLHIEEKPRIFEEKQRVCGTHNGTFVENAICTIACHWFDCLNNNRSLMFERND